MNDFLWSLLYEIYIVPKFIALFWIIDAAWYRLQELDTLIQNIYEDKVLGKVSEDVAMKLIAKYETEQKELSVEVADLEEKFSTIRQDEEDVALFMERLRKYTDVQELTREMCLELIEYITLDT